MILIINLSTKFSTPQTKKQKFSKAIHIFLKYRRILYKMSRHFT